MFKKIKIQKTKNIDSKNPIPFHTPLHIINTPANSNTTHPFTERFIICRHLFDALASIQYFMLIHMLTTELVPHSYPQSFHMTIRLLPLTDKSASPVH